MKRFFSKVVSYVVFKFSIKIFVVLHFGFSPVRYTLKGGECRQIYFLEGNAIPAPILFLLNFS